MGRSGNGRKDRDEDLLLFRELQRREKERIATLLQPVSDDFEPNSGGIVVPAAAPHNNALFRINRGSAGCDLFADKEKTDYDWLKTPPATPLFPSLEMEANAPELVIQRDLPIHPLTRFSSGGNKARSTRPKSPNPKPRLPSRSAAPSHRTTNEIASSSKTVTKANTNIPPKSSNQKEKDSFLTSNLRLATTTTIDAENRRQQPRSRGVSPSVRSTIPPPEFPGFSNQAPPNLRADRAASATRGRPSGNPKKPEPTTPKLIPRRQSCSPSVARGRRDEPNKTNNTKSSVIGTVNQVLGSRMVDKLMSARKSSANAEDKETISRPKSSGADNSNVLKQVEMKRERNYNSRDLGVFFNRGSTRVD